MASKATVGSLRVMLGLDSAQFTAGLTKAQMGLQKFGAIAKAGALAIGAAMVTAGGAVGIAMKGMIDDADAMSKLAQSIGVPIEELSKLRYAASLADVDLDALGKGLKRLSATMFEASQTATSAAAKSFAMLGISVRDAEGDMRPVTGVIQDLAARFKRMPDGVEKTALAMKIFGKSGADLIPMLNSGSDGLAEMYAEAEELGLVLDEKTGVAAENFNDNLTRLGAVKDGIITKIAAGMLPAFEGLSAALVTASKDSGVMQGVATFLGRTLQSLATAAITTAGFFTVLATDIATAATVAWKFAQMDYAGAAKALLEGTTRHNAALATINRMNTAIWRPPAGGSAGGVPPAAAALNSVAGAGDRARRSTERLTDAQREAQRAAEELRREGERTFEQTRTPLEQYTARVAELGRQLRAAAIDQDTFNRAMKDARDNFDQDDPLTRAGAAFREDLRDKREEERKDRIEMAEEHEEDLRQSTYEGISDGLRAAADGNLGQYLANRIREALFDRLATTLTDILRGPKGGNGGVIGAVSSAASMFKSVAGGMNVPGFATGGSFKVGGQAGIDQNLVSFRATKGEMVDIRRPGQDIGSGSLAVHVTPSPYFDVAVERVAAPVAQQAASQMGRTVLDATRRGAPGMQQRQRRLGTV